jgi:hypothetical protein
MAASQVADVLARAWVSSASTRTDAEATPQGGAVPLTTCKSVRVPRKGGNENNDADYYNGRPSKYVWPGGHLEYLVVPDDIGNNRVPEWFDEASVKATKRRSSCAPSKASAPPGTGHCCGSACSAASTPPSTLADA